MKFVEAFGDDDIVALYKQLGNIVGEQGKTLSLPDEHVSPCVYE